jgi:Arc/MetJ-type ribon-helix-helix transcriptional regulator
MSVMQFAVPSHLETFLDDMVRQGVVASKPDAVLYALNQLMTEYNSGKFRIGDHDVYDR